MLVSKAGHVKVIDFGIASARGRLQETAVGVIKGKVRYIAPELIDRRRFAGGKPPDHRVDLWSAGVVLHELLAEARLFPLATPDVVFTAITDDEIPDLGAAGVCDAELASIVSRALQRKRDDRWPTAQAFSDALRRWVFSRDPSFTSSQLARAMKAVASPQAPLAPVARTTADVRDLPTRSLVGPVTDPDG